jgi:hypothetical protein
MTIKKLSKGWIRDTIQENYSVFRWYEKGETIASLVQGDIEDEAEWRISGKGFDSIQARGNKELMLRRTDAHNIAKIETLIRREKMK